MVNMRNLIIIASFIGLVMIGAILVAGSFNKDSNYNNDTNNSSNQGSELKWYTDLNSAIAEAQKTNKPIFAVFSASWCPACQQLESETLTDPRVQQKIAQKYIAVKIDTDSNPDLSSTYGIRGIPAIIILDSNGAPVQNFVGYQSPDELLSIL
jgi:thiol:disulfide interchange protein